MKAKVCDDCGYTGIPARDEFGSLILDGMAWFGAFAIAGITGIIPIAVIGPLFSIWHLLTFRSHRCPKCGNWSMHRIHGQHKTFNWQTRFHH